MFDLGWTELLIIGVVALIVVGPKDLPKMFRTLGQVTAKARNMAREFQRAMDSAADEAGVKDIARDLRNTASGKDIKDAMGFDELDKEMRAMGRPDQWGKDGTKKPGKSSTPKAKPDPAAPPPGAPVDADEAAVRADDRAQATRTSQSVAMDEERSKRAQRAAEARARAAEIRARRQAAEPSAPASDAGGKKKPPPAAAPSAERAPDAEG
jgi:sec-independent protein translocase protein TatB